MSVRALSTKLKSLHSFLLHKPKFLSTTQPNQQLISEISRVLSDNRHPHNDIHQALTPFSPHISTALVEHVLKRCKYLGFSAHRFFLWAKTLPDFQHSPESHRILLDILVSNKQFAILWDFLIEIRESKYCVIKRDWFWIVFKGYARGGLPGEAVRAVGRMKEFGLKPNVEDVDALLYVLCKKKHVRCAQEFFDRVKGQYDVGLKSFSILVRGWGDIGESGEARRVFDEICERGLMPDVPAYNSVMEALCKGGNVDEAYVLFNEMKGKGVEPDACSFGVFIRAFCERDDVHSVFRVVDSMRRRNLVPNLFTYNCIIKRLCRNGKVDEAYELLDEMVERGVYPDAWSYNAILAYHCEHSEVNRALRLISRMAKENCFPDKHTYNMVLKLLVRVGRFDRATEVWDSMEGRGFYPSVSTYSVMIHELPKKKGKLEEACKYFEMMVDDGLPPYYSTVEMLRNRLVGLGLSDIAEILADKMDRSTSGPIQELANVMRGNKSKARPRNDESDFESD